MSLVRSWLGVFMMTGLLHVAHVHTCTCTCCCIHVHIHVHVHVHVHVVACVTNLDVHVLCCCGPLPHTSLLAHVPQAHCVGRIWLLPTRTFPMGGTVVREGGYVRMLTGLWLPGATGWQGAFVPKPGPFSPRIEQYCIQGQSDPTVGRDAFPPRAVKSCAE